MAFVKVNEKAFETNEFHPIPVGSKVKVSVFDIKEGVTGPNSKSPGMKQFVYTAKITEDFEFPWSDDQGNSGTQNAKGREIRFNYIPLDPNAGNAWALVAFAEAVGWAASKEQGVDVPDDLTDVLGTEFIATIRQSKGQDGKTYNQIGSTAKIGKGGTKAKEDKAKVKDWNEL